jgi:hypothetical protein
MRRTKAHVYDKQSVAWDIIGLFIVFCIAVGFLFNCWYFNIPLK